MKVADVKHMVFGECHSDRDWTHNLQRTLSTQSRFDLFQVRRSEVKTATNSWSKNRRKVWLKSPRHRKRRSTAWNQHSQGQALLIISNYYFSCFSWTVHANPLTVLGFSSRDRAELPNCCDIAGWAIHHSISFRILVDMRWNNLYRLDFYST